MHKLHCLESVCQELLAYPRFVLSIPQGWVFPLPEVTFPTHTPVCKRPVVLVPGFLGRGLEFKALRVALLNAGHPVYIVPMGNQMGDIERKTRDLAKFLEKYNLSDFYLLGYSMGGWIALGLFPAWNQKVFRLITLGVSFQGTQSAYCLPFCKASFQLMYHSTFVQTHYPQPQERHPWHLNLIARRDEITRPYQTCLIQPIYRQIKLPVVGHLNLVMSLVGVQAISQIIAQEEKMGKLPLKSIWPKLKVLPPKWVA